MQEDHLSISRGRSAECTTVRKTVPDLLLVHYSDPDQCSFAVVTFTNEYARNFFKSYYDGSKWQQAGITADRKGLEIRAVDAHIGPPQTLTRETLVKDPAARGSRTDLADDKGMGGHRGPEQDELTQPRRRRSRDRSRSDRRHRGSRSSQGDDGDLRTSDHTMRDRNRRTRVYDGRGIEQLWSRSSQGDDGDLRTSDHTSSGCRIDFEPCGPLCNGCCIGCWHLREDPMTPPSYMWQQPQPTAFLTPPSIFVTPVASQAFWASIGPVREGRI